MRLLLASLIFLVTVLDMQLGSGNASLQTAALAAAILLGGTVVLDFLWLDPPRWRRQDRPLDAARPPAD